MIFNYKIYLNKNGKLATVIFAARSWSEAYEPFKALPLVGLVRAPV